MGVSFAMAGDVMTSLSRENTPGALTVGPV